MFFSEEEYLWIQSEKFVKLFILVNKIIDITIRRISRYIYIVNGEEFKIFPYSSRDEKISKNLSFLKRSR